MTEEYLLKDIEMKSTLNFKPNYNITFHRGINQVGVLDFNGPEMTFSGDMDESVKLFLGLVATSFKGRLEQERAEEREACAKVCDGVQDCGPENGCCPTYWNESLERAAAAIRARGQE